MQDCYVGDVGDFVKYGLLRAIRVTKCLGVAWYLHPDGGPAGDGRHADYLQDPGEWRHLDTKLFDTLKGIPIAEAIALAEGRTAVIYHHNSRRPGGHLNEIRWLKTELPRGTMAYYWRRLSNRTFFVINPDDGVRRRLREFEKRWSDRGQLV